MTARDKLFTKFGGPRIGVKHALGFYKLTFSSGIETLKYEAKAGNILPNDIYRLKGNGNKDNPGLLAQYLFDIPARKQKLKEWSNYSI